jgi:hypothetical protein
MAVGGIETGPIKNLNNQPRREINIPSNGQDWVAFAASVKQIWKNGDDKQPTTVPTSTPATEPKEGVDIYG